MFEEQTFNKLFAGIALNCKILTIRCTDDYMGAEGRGRDFTSGVLDYKSKGAAIIITLGEMEAEFTLPQARIIMNAMIHYASEAARTHGRD